MKVITFNCGSSTLKFQCVEVELEETSLGRERRLAYGSIDRIGSKGAIKFTAKDGVSLSEAISVADHGEGTRRVLDWLGSLGLLEHDGVGS